MKEAPNSQPGRPLLNRRKILASGLRGWALLPDVPFSKEHLRQSLDPSLSPTDSRALVAAVALGGDALPPAWLKPTSLGRTHKGPKACTTSGSCQGSLSVSCHRVGHTPPSSLHTELPLLHAKQRQPAPQPKDSSLQFAQLARDGHRAEMVLSRQ